MRVDRYLWVFLQIAYSESYLAGRGCVKLFFFFLSVVACLDFLFLVYIGYECPVSYVHQDCVVALSKLAQQLWVPCDVLGCFNIKYPCPIYHWRWELSMPSQISWLWRPCRRPSLQSNKFLLLAFVIYMCHERIEDCLLPACCRLVLMHDESVSLPWFWCSIEFLWWLGPGAAGGTGADVLQSFAQYSHLPQWPHYISLLWSWGKTFVVCFLVVLSWNLRLRNIFQNWTTKASSSDWLDWLVVRPRLP